VSSKKTGGRKKGLPAEGTEKENGARRVLQKRNRAPLLVGKRTSPHEKGREEGRGYFVRQWGENISIERFEARVGNAKKTSDVPKARGGVNRGTWIRDKS